MIVSYSEIINEVIRGLGLESESVETRVRDSIKLRINEAQDVVFYNEDWEWRKQTFYITTTAPYNTGTIALTQGSRTVTGTATGWTDKLKVGYIVVDAKIYKIDAIISGTSLKLKAPFDKPTTSGKSYTIVFPNQMLDPNIAAIVSVKRNGQDIACVQKSRLNTDIISTGEPSQCAMGDRTDEDYYNTNTVSVTQGSNTITGSSTAFSSEMEGMPFRVNEFSKSYTIRNVVSPTSITLNEAYEGETGVAKTYKIGAKGTQLITFRNVPNDYYFMEIEALIHAPKLVNNNDISLIPNHMPLISCAIWLALTDLEGKNPVRIQQARVDFERTLKQLKSTYRVLTNVQWKSHPNPNMYPNGRSRYNNNPLER